MRTCDQSASSSSAMINGSEVIDPCPISVAADMMVMLPSVAMLTQGLSIWPVRSTAKTAASARPPSAMPNDRPAAPIIIWRRDTGISNSMKGLFMSRLQRRALNSAYNALIGPTATDVGAHVRDDLGAGRLWLLAKQVGRAHDLTGLTVAALRYPLGQPSFLERMAGVRRQPFDRGYRLACDVRHLRLAGERALAIDVHHAGAAQTRAAAEFGAGELEALSDHPQKRRCGRCVGGRCLAVDSEVRGHLFPP